MPMVRNQNSSIRPQKRITVQDFGTSVEDRGVVRAELVNGFTILRSSRVRSTPGGLCKKLQLRR
jgi:hypothetical protein